MTTMTPTSAAPGPVAWPGPQRRPAAVASGWAFTAGDLLRVVRQRMVLVLLVWLLLIGATIALTALWIVYLPKYEAQAYVKVESVNPSDPIEDRTAQRVDPQVMEMLVKDQAVFVTSPDVLQRAAEDPEVKNTSWYRNLIALNDPTRSPIDELADILTAAPVPATSYMVVSASGKVPSELPTIVNTVVQKYYDRVNELTKLTYRSEADRLERETELARRELDKKNAELDQRRAELPASVLTSSTNTTNEELMTLSSLRTELEMAKIGRKGIYERLKEAKPEDMPITPEMQAYVENDPDVAGLRYQVDQLQQQIDSASSSYGSNHRLVKTATGQLQALNDRLASEQLRKLAEFRNQQLQMAQDDYYRAQSQEQEVAERVVTAEAKQRDLDAKVARYVRGLEERQALNTSYENLQRQREVLNMQLRREKTFQISIASLAVPPKRRSAPQWYLNVPIGVVVGLMLAVGLAVLLELADTSVRTPRDMTRHTALPVLGTIPTLDDEEVAIERIELATVEAPHSVIAEAFRQLRTNLFFSAPVEHQSALLFTSPGAGDGKTSVAINVAASLAGSGRRVLLIDANFRRPALARLFPSMRPEGLSNVLIGQSRLPDVVVQSEIPGLDLLGTGPTPPNPAELLGGHYLRDLIADARSMYDQIIIDGPPVLLVSDALVLAGSADGVVLVCRFRNTSRGALLRARSQLEAIGARILGGVLNAVQTTRGGYFRKQYRAFYDYHGEEEKGAPSPRLATGEKPAVPPPSDEAGSIGQDLEALDRQNEQSDVAEDESVSEAPDGTIVEGDAADKRVAKAASPTDPFNEPAQPNSDEPEASA